MVDFSSEKYSGSRTLDTGTPGTSREIYSEDADDGTQSIELINSRVYQNIIKLCSFRRLIKGFISMQNYAHLVVLYTTKTQGKYLICRTNYEYVK